MIAHLQEPALIGSTELTQNAVRQPRLPLQLAEPRAQLRKGKTRAGGRKEPDEGHGTLGGAPVGNPDLLFAQSQNLADFGRVDPERGEGVRLLRLEKNVRHPLVRSLDKGGALPGSAHALASLERQEGGSGNRVERLDPPVEQHGDPSERGEVKGS